MFSVWQEKLHSEGLGIFCLLYKDCNRTDWQYYFCLQNRNRMV